MFFSLLHIEHSGLPKSVRREDATDIVVFLNDCLANDTPPGHLRPTGQELSSVGSNGGALHQDWQVFSTCTSLHWNFWMELMHMFPSFLGFKF